MLYTLISQQSALWYQQPNCPARSLVAYIEKMGFLRDAQIEAIKTYLFLKLQGKNKPLSELFCEGLFLQNEDLATLNINEAARKAFGGDSAARALFEFARRKDDSGIKAMLPALEKQLIDNPSGLNCGQVIQQMFYGVAYSDYLFSLPMGAGKTFLMAAIIYLDLYFAMNEPENKLFAHNFVLLVPSGLKSSIIPSLKTIENFDPNWVLPEPAASAVRKLIKFEVLDQPKSAQKNNKARSPNAQKVSQYQPFADLMGLVIVTNAEKVILDKVKADAQGTIDFQGNDEKSKVANELRHLIGKIPNLQILIDEVHHAATDEIKLRQVVNYWNANGNINGVLGFSGTPYLSKSDDLRLTPGVSLTTKQIANTVFYYPLTRAIQRFLKKPVVETISELSSREIVRQGVTEFLERYGKKEYANGTTAKLAIYCGSIDRLENEVYPLLTGELGIPPDDILRYHRGNKDHSAPIGAEAEWNSLDTISHKKIILLVQIGKEGWDCRSLTGVILSQKGDCPANMVLQTSCRCLRQMDGGTETAGIWLNAENAKTLDKQLQEEQNTSIAEINKLGKGDTTPVRPRISRMGHLRLPKLEFYKLCVTYQTVTTADASPSIGLAALSLPQKRVASTKTGSLLPGGTQTQQFHETERGELADFSAWLLFVTKGSFNTISLSDLRPFEPMLCALFETITYPEGDARRFNALYDTEAIAAQIRLAFHAPRTFHSSEENIKDEAFLLVAGDLPPISTTAKYVVPSVEDTALILKMDTDGQTAAQYQEAKRADFERAKQILISQGMNAGLLAVPDTAISTAVANKDRSFHIIPYQFDSTLERDFLEEALGQIALQQHCLELYFNGDGNLTEFRIECFAETAHGWNRVGKYTPDFLLVQRKNDQIYRAMIIETKGKGFGDQKEFVARRRFVEKHFVPRNNDNFGYDRFRYLYLSDEQEMDANLRKLCDEANRFFTK